MSIVIVNQVEVQGLMSRGQAVVNYEMVSKVHGVDINVIRNAYSRNASHFEEGVDTWVIEGKELQLLSDSIMLRDRVPSMRVFTEMGYYLLVKPLRDETAWRVQREMGKAYFISTHEQQSLPARPLTIIEQLEGLKAAYYFLQESGLADDHTRIYTREQGHNLIRSVGPYPGQQPLQIPQSTTLKEQFFMIEDMKNHLPKMPDKAWMTHRGPIGRVVSGAIHTAAPDVVPNRVKKDVNGSERDVNEWPMAYWDIAMAAAESYISKRVQSAKAE